MKLRILGCSGSVGGPNNPASGYLIHDVEGQDVLIDCGPGILAELQQVAVKQIFTNKKVYFISVLRLIVLPVFALILIKLSHLAAFSADGDKIMLIVFLAIITPSASTVTQMCQVYGNDSQYASAINVVTTLFSIVSMPLLVMLFQMF